ncbi:MAG TPA: prephenate dehydrogenase/arogenate dehydrogenase family protein [Candidatus Baltobacteraceae bacterium]|jgi:prephenate dehydrogenase|nr:prephenate dehydrogenase/arogenate dehydrogenase family protein [Candidatus Baltobacteraceae bacterium]
MRWNNISIVGAGLLGGSIALAVKHRGLASKVFACVRSDSTRDLCARLEIADVITKDIKTAVETSELVVLCTPLSQMAAMAAQMQPFLKPGTIVTDVGSVKTTVVNELEPILRRDGVEFVGSHPMAGSEKIGVASARADLFQNAVCLITPSLRTSLQAVSRVENFWKVLGGWPIRMTPETHDDLVSRSSHLPHVVAAELANYVLSPVHPKEQARVCANGFRDTTRIASGSPEMWRDIALANRKNLGRVLGVFIEDLQEFQLALERRDVEAIEEFFAKAKQRRDGWCEHSPAASPE